MVDVGAQAHAALPSPDETYILVASQNGKRVHRINTDYLHNAFALDTNATLDLATGTTTNVWTSLFELRSKHRLQELCQ